MNMPIFIYSQLLATKFFIPVSAHPLISRPRLTALLHKSLKYPLTLLSAPAGFGKTMLLSAWAQSLPTNTALVAWVSLDKEDNEPQQFWTYILSSLDQQKPELFTPLLKYLQSPPAPPLMHMLTLLINLLAESTDDFVLILDDYHVITEPQIHTSLSYLVEHLPSQMHILLATRIDPPLPLSLWQARRQMLELRTDQLRCTAQETRTFFKKVKGIRFSDEMIQTMTDRTEGWLVGLQLLALSLQEHDDPTRLLDEASGDQRYILDYLTEEVLRQQPQEVQTFLLSTCILERLSAALCDAVTEQPGSQQMLQRLKQANLFVVSLDSKQQWYRYHPLFAQALHYQLEQTDEDLVLTLHHRASMWYAQHDQSTEAILHALHAHQWEWAADLIERKSLPLMTLTWGASRHQLATLQQWLRQLPVDIMGSRPSLCLTCAQMLLFVAPPSMLAAWFDAAQARLTASLSMETLEDASPSIALSQTQQEQQNLLGRVLAFRAVQRSFQEDGHTALSLSQQALALLSPENILGRAQALCAHLLAYYVSSLNDAEAAIQSGLEAASLAQVARQPAVAISFMGVTANFMIGAGQLQEALQVTQQARLLGNKLGDMVLPDVGWPTACQAEILREWNQLNAARSLALQAISQCEQTQSMASLAFINRAYAVLLRVSLSRGELDAARSALQEFERVNMSTNQPYSSYTRSFFTTVDQVKLWLACGELDRAMRWAEKLDQGKRYGTPFAHERQDAAYARILLATKQPALALQRLEPVLQRATTGKRWGHVIEVRILQALAYQMLQNQRPALCALSEAIHIAEPEGYIRSFVDEGPPMAALLSGLRHEQYSHGLTTPYLDTLLAAFAQQSPAHKLQLRQEAKHATTTPLLTPLSEQELEVLQLLARGASNLEIAQELVIAIGTVKRHVSHIFSKLGVQNRLQAVIQAQELGLLAEQI